MERIDKLVSLDDGGGITADELPPTPDPRRFEGLEVVRVQMSDARDLVIVDVPLQRVPPRKRLHATPDHQSTLEIVRPSFDAFVVGHTRLEAVVVQMHPLHPNSATYPLLRLSPTTVGFDVAFEVGNAPVLLNVIASDDGAPGAKSPPDEQGVVFALEVTRGDVTFVRMQAPAGARRSDAPLGFGGSGLGRSVLAVGEREVVHISVRLGAVGGMRWDRQAGGNRRVAPAEGRGWDLGGAVEELRIGKSGRRTDRR